MIRSRVEFTLHKEIPPSATIRLVQAVLLALPLLLYLLLPTRNYYWDGVGISLEVEKGLPPHLLLYPSHLIYALWGDWLYRGVAALGIHARALFLFQIANTLLAGASVALVCLLLLQAGASRMWSTVAALAFAFSATWWKFATDADAYIPSIFFVLCAYVLLGQRRSAVVAGLATFAAMMFHQLAIIFLPAAIVRLRKDRAAIVAYLSAALIPTATVYWLAYNSVAKAGGAAGFLAWLTIHSPDSGFSFRLGTDLMLSLRGTLRLIFGGKLTELPPGPLFKLMLASLALALAAVCLYVWRARGQIKFRPAAASYVVWLASYVAFLFFWMPQNTFYRLFYLPPLIAMFALSAAETPDLRRLRQAMALCIFLWNFTFFIYPQSRIESNGPLRFALAQHDTWRRGTAVLFHNFATDLWTISYFNPQVAWIGVDRPDPAQLDKDLAYARDQGQALWLETSAYDLLWSNGATRDWLIAHQRPGELIHFNDGKHDFRFHCAR